MDSFPNELILNICQYLGVKSLTNCRQVSRRWKECAEQTRLTKMVLRSPADRAKRVWYYSYLPVDDDDIINISTFIQCRNMSFSLEYLTALIIDTPLTYGDVSLLNLLQRLKHLEFPSLAYQEAPPPEITLPLLKVLNIYRAAYSGFDYVVNAPNLEVLSCMTRLNGLQFPHSESVKKLQIADRQIVHRFRNVEVFSCFNSESIVSDLFVQLPKLNEIHFVDGYFKNTCSKHLDFDATKRAMNWLIEQKILLGKTNLKLHFLGELLDDDEKMFEDYGFDEKFKEIFEDDFEI